jgi:hypothetical protein
MAVERCQELTPPSIYFILSAHSWPFIYFLSRGIDVNAVLTHLNKYFLYIELILNILKIIAFTPIEL